MEIIPIAETEPLQVAAKLRHLPDLVVLDSALRGGPLGRYSWVAADPVGRFEIRGGQGHWQGRPVAGDPFAALRRLLEQVPGTLPDGLPPFAGGAIGYLAYEAGRLCEVQPVPAGGLAVPDALFGLYDRVVCFDHRTGGTHIVARSWPGHEGRAGPGAAEWAALLAGPPVALPPAPAITGWRANFDRDGYRAAVARVIAAILDGELFQANIAQRFEAALPAGFDPLAFYARLRAVNPAPFAAFLDFGELVVASSSPERFLSLRGEAIEARPIKGTSARSPDPALDRAAAAALAASVKDRAENVMIVDLLRNDLSKVAKAGSVAVPVLCGLESYAGVHHLVSVVEAALAPGYDAVDLVRAAFPGGSVTGAPKPRAMALIAALEQVPRGVYCGAIGALGFDGGLELSIAIRTVSFKDGVARFHVGGGITTLSDPAAEYDETLTKAARIFAACAGGGVP